MTVIVTPVTVISRYQSHMVTIDAISVLCAQLTRDLFAIAKFLFFFTTKPDPCRCVMWCRFCSPVNSSCVIRQTEGKSISKSFANPRIEFRTYFLPCELAGLHVKWFRLWSIHFFRDTVLPTNRSVCLVYFILIPGWRSATGRKPVVGNAIPASFSNPGI